MMRSIVDPAECLKPISLRDTPEDRAGASLTDLHEHVEDELREDLHLWRELVEDNLSVVVLRGLQVPGDCGVEES